MTIRKEKYPGLDPLPPFFADRYPPVAIVEEDSCIACDRCPPVCFFDAIVMEQRPHRKYKRTAVIIEENCTGCGLCFEACPVDAIKWIPDKAGLPGPPKSSDSVEDTDL